MPPQKCYTKRKQQCLDSPNCNWIVGKGCKENAMSPVRKPRSGPKCYTKRKQQCLDSPDCNWIVGKGCKENVGSPVRSPTRSPIRSPVRSQKKSLPDPERSRSIETAIARGFTPGKIALLKRYNPMYRAVLRSSPKVMMGKLNKQELSKRKISAPNPKCYKYSKNKCIFKPSCKYNFSAKKCVKDAIFKGAPPFAYQPDTSIANTSSIAEEYITALRKFYSKNGLPMGTPIFQTSADVEYSVEVLARVCCQNTNSQLFKAQFLDPILFSGKINHAGEIAFHVKDVKDEKDEKEYRWRRRSKYVDNMNEIINITLIDQFMVNIFNLAVENEEDAHANTLIILKLKNKIYAYHYEPHGAGLYTDNVYMISRVISDLDAFFASHGYEFAFYEVGAEGGGISDVLYEFDFGLCSVIEMFNAIIYAQVMEMYLQHYEFNELTFRRLLKNTGFVIYDVLYKKKEKGKRQTFKVVINVVYSIIQMHFENDTIDFRYLSRLFLDEYEDLQLEEEYIYGKYPEEFKEDHGVMWRDIFP